MRQFDPNSLVPTVHAADRIRMDSVGNILVHTAVVPEDAFAVRIFTVKWLDTGDGGHLPTALTIVLNVDGVRAPAVAGILFPAPAAQVMRTSNHTWLHSLRNPDLVDKVTDICVQTCLLYTSPSPRDRQKSRMPSSA